MKVATKLGRGWRRRRMIRITWSIRSSPSSVLQNHQEGINTIRTNHTCTDNTWGEALTMGRTHMEKENMNVKLVIFYMREHVYKHRCVSFTNYVCPSQIMCVLHKFQALWLVDTAQNVSEVMLEFAPGSSEFSARWRHWFNFAVALYTAKTTVLPTSRQCSPRI